MTQLNSMNSNRPTVVEKYIVTETAELIYDADALAKWNEICATLGLEGQQKLNVETAKSPVPFLYMNEGLTRVFKVLCPVVDLVAKYNRAPIPLEVLDLVALSIKEGYFQKIEIWHDDQKQDPVAIGISYDFILVSEVWKCHWDAKLKSVAECGQWLKEHNLKPYSESTCSCENDVKHYLLARWGDVAKPLEVLKAEAIERYSGQQRLEAEKNIKEAQRKLEDLEADVKRYFN